MPGDPSPLLQQKPPTPPALSGRDSGWPSVEDGCNFPKAGESPIVPQPLLPGPQNWVGHRDLGIGGVKVEVPVIEPVRWASQLLRTDGHGLGPAASPGLCPEGLRAPPELELEQGPEWSPREPWAMGHICPSSEASSVKRVGGRERQERAHPADRDMGKSEGQRRTQVMRGTKD